MLTLEITAVICCAIAVSVFLVWTVFQCADRGEEEQMESRAAEPLIRKKGNDNLEFSNNNNRNNNNYNNSNNSNVSSTSGNTKATNGPPVIPKFTNRVDGSNPSGGIKFAEKSVIFCKCGGGSPVIKLVPCGHNSLCLHCAQLEKSCPTCGTAITDSVPSFRDISV